MHKSDELQLRTKQFALRVIRLCRTLPHDAEGWVIGRQLLRCGTAVAANYRAACRSRSREEFASRIAVVLEESDESGFWLDLAGTVPASRLTDLIGEAEELTKIFSAARHTTQEQIRNQKSEIGNP